MFMILISQFVDFMVNLIRIGIKWSEILKIWIISQPF